MRDTNKNEILYAIEKLSRKFDIMQGQMSDMQKEVVKIPEMQKEVAKISEMQKEIINISQRIAVIEHEHGDKLKALFDAFMMNNEKIYGEQERISFCEKKLESHDTEIYYLKTKVQGL